MKELVSVVVPVCNSAPWLDRCLESLTGQTYENLEILLVDDGSRDGSGALCDRWAAEDPRIRVRHQENAGAGHARNRGMEMARGKFLLFADSDDYADPAMVEKAMACQVRENAQAVLFGSHQLRGGKLLPGQVTAPRRRYRQEEIRRELLPGLFSRSQGLGISPWGKLLAAEALEGVRFPEDREAISEDGFFTLSLFARLTGAAVLPECLYYYCRRPDSLSRSPDPRGYSRCCSFLESSLSRAEELGLPGELKDAVRARFHGLVLNHLTQLAAGKQWQQLRRILRDPVLLGTLEEPVLALDAPLPRLFWRCLKRGRRSVCSVLLAANSLRRKWRDDL